MGWANATIAGRRGVHQPRHVEEEIVRSMSGAYCIESNDAWSGYVRFIHISLSFPFALRLSLGLKFRWIYDLIAP